MQQNQTSINDIPTDILSLILSYLNIKELAKASMVCRKWKFIYDNSSYLNSWKKVHLINYTYKKDEEAKSKASHRNWGYFYKSDNNVYVRQSLINEGLKKLNSHLKSITNNVTKAKTILELINYLENLKTEQPPFEGIFSSIEEFRQYGDDTRLDALQGIIEYLNNLYIRIAAENDLNEKLPLIMNDHKKFTERSNNFERKLRFFHRTKNYVSYTAIFSELPIVIGFIGCIIDLIKNHGKISTIGMGFAVTACAGLTLLTISLSILCCWRLQPEQMSQRINFNQADDEEQIEQGIAKASNIFP